MPCGSKDPPSVAIHARWFAPPASPSEGSAPGKGGIRGGPLVVQRGLRSAPGKGAPPTFLARRPSKSYR